MIVFGDTRLKKYVWEHRNNSNTVFIDMSLDDIYENWFAQRIAIRRDERLKWPFYSSKIAF
jgi:hypothetical protein